jgi:uncharacterized protein YukE
MSLNIDLDYEAVNGIANQMLAQKNTLESYLDSISQAVHNLTGVWQGSAASELEDLYNNYIQCNLQWFVELINDNIGELERSTKMLMELDALLSRLFDH